MWEEVFEPASSQFGLAPVRADRISDTGEIPDQIFEYLRDADIVIADLSHANPNVMYELGLRHSRPGVTIQIGEYGLLPFDVTTIRTIQFNRTTAGLIGARDDLIVALRTALSGGGTPLRATTIFETNATRSEESVANDVARSVAPDVDTVEPDDPGFLEVLAEGEAGIAHVSQVLTSATARLNEVSDIARAAGERLPTSFAGRLQVARSLAQDLAPAADGLESDANDFYGDLMSVDAMLRYVFERIASGAERIDDARGFFGAIINLVDAAEGSAVGMTNFRNSVPQLRRMARDLEPVSRTLERAASRFLEGISMMSTWRAPAESLILADDSED